MARNRKRGDESGDAPGRPPERLCTIQPEFREDLLYWIETDRGTARRLMRIVEDVLREPFAGVGKPEPLRHMLAGCWSRRLTEEHRVVYRVDAHTIDFLAARYHY